MARICFFGTYTCAEGYPVNRVLIKGLRRAGAAVRECRQDLWGGFLYEGLRSWRSPLWLAALLVRIPATYVRLVWKYLRTAEHDCVIVGYAGYIDVLLARLLKGRRTLVLVAFISLYDTLVLDREQVRAGSLKAAALRFVDRLAFRAADVVLVDTEEQRRHFSVLFDLPISKFLRSFVGEDDDDFAPREASGGKSDELRVLFFGTYVPLHGIDVIIEAAHVLANEKGIDFTIVGSGQLYSRLRAVAADLELINVDFVDRWVSTSDLTTYLSNADVSLGIFGVTPKAGRVIPYKVFDALAMRKPVVTRDSAAIREVLSDGRTALLCAPGDGAALARCLVRLRADPHLRAAIGEADWWLK